MLTISRITLPMIMLAFVSCLCGKPYFTIHPTNRTVINPTETLTLTGSAIGNGNVSYEWIFNGQVIATTPTLTKRIEGYQDQGPYILSATDSSDRLRTDIACFVNVSYWGEGKAVAPDAPSGLSDVVAVAAAQFGPTDPSTKWFLALKGDGSLVKWGYSPGVYFDVPEQFQNANVGAISAAGGSGVALGPYGNIYAWPNPATTGSFFYNDPVIGIFAGGPSNWLATTASGNVYSSLLLLGPVNNRAYPFYPMGTPGNLVNTTNPARSASSGRVGGTVWSTNAIKTVSNSLSEYLSFCYKLNAGGSIEGSYMYWSGSVYAYGAVPMPSIVASSEAKPIDIALSGNRLSILFNDGEIISWENHTADGASIELKDIQSVTMEGAVSISGDCYGGFIALKALLAPEILANPVSVNANAGQAFTLAPRIKGNPLVFEWYKDGAVISGATASTLTVNTSTLSDAGFYECKASNSLGFVTTTPTSVQVNQAPIIITQPSSAVAVTGSSITFSLIATGSPSPTYQWKKSSIPISGATSSTYTISNITAAAAGNYSCVVTNSIGSVVSSVATLAVNSLPIFTIAPSGAILNPGANYILSSTVTGTLPITYQWLLNGQAIEGATASSYSIVGANFSHEGTYALRATNPAGNTTSLPALIHLSVTVGSVDSDGDGFSDSLERYFSPLGFSPIINSSSLINRFKAIAAQIGPYYTADQMRDLAVGSPTLQRGANGNFLLDVTVQESTDLNTWTKRTLSAPMLTYPGGVLRLELPPLDSSTQFYRLRSQPAP